MNPGNQVVGENEISIFTLLLILVKIDILVCLNIAQLLPYHAYNYKKLIKFGRALFIFNTFFRVTPIN